MQYLESFTLPSADAEENYFLNFPPELEMMCYGHESIYPFKIFPQKQFERMNFEPITIFYGGNGSGKSTLLNMIAEKLSLRRSAPWNNTPFAKAYLERCSFSSPYGKRIPKESRIITSDDVFDFLLDIRAINEGVADRRETLFAEYDAFRQKATHETTYEFRSMEDYESLKHRNELNRSTKSAFTARHMQKKELSGKSNGESAFWYFTTQIGENALYLLDEPENSLSVKLQQKLRQFIEDSARFYHCQFLISSHSPFLLSMKGAKIYDLDACPVTEKPWTELENVRLYYDFFEKHRSDFQKIKQYSKGDL